MKKTLLALAVLGGFATAAHAENSVTVYGNIDVGIMSSSSAGTHTTGMQSTQISPSYFGFKGSEDLGGGLKAGFDLEGGFMPSTGSGNADQASNTLFGRSANVTVGGDWGTIGVGLQWDPAYLASIPTDPRGSSMSLSSLNFWVLGTNGSAASQHGDWDANAISYSYAGNGMTVGVSHSFGGQSGSSSALSGDSIGVTYSNSGFIISGDYLTQNAGTATGGNTSNKVAGVGVGYSGGPFAVRANYQRFQSGFDVNGNNAADDVKLWGIGGDWTSGPNKLNLSYYHSKDDGAGLGGSLREIALLETYSLSKRTSLYAQIASLSVDKNAGSLNDIVIWTNAASVPASGGNVGIIGLGIQHSF